MIKYMLYDRNTGTINPSFASASTIDAIITDAQSHGLLYVLGHWDPKETFVNGAGQLQRRDGADPVPFNFVLPPPPTVEAANG